MKLNKNIFRIINFVSFVIQLLKYCLSDIPPLKLKNISNICKFQMLGPLNIIEDDVYTSILIITDTINSIDWLLTIVYGSKLLSTRWPIWVGLMTIKGIVQDGVHQFWRNYRGEIEN